jgi:hypothetical protein
MAKILFSWFTRGGMHLPAINLWKRNFIPQVQFTVISSIAAEKSVPITSMVSGSNGPAAFSRRQFGFPCIESGRDCTCSQTLHDISRNDFGRRSKGVMSLTSRRIIGT